MFDKIWKWILEKIFKVFAVIFIISSVPILLVGCFGFLILFFAVQLFSFSFEKKREFVETEIKQYKSIKKMMSKENIKYFRICVGEGNSNFFCSCGNLLFIKDMKNSLIYKCVKCGEVYLVEDFEKKEGKENLNGLPSLS